MNRVLVVGGGLAGVLAAVEASRAGARVTLVRRAYGMTALSAGLIDVAPTPPEAMAPPPAGTPAPAEGEGRVSGALRELHDRLPDTLPLLECLLPYARRAWHPYRVVGPQLDELPRALEALRAGCGDLELTPLAPAKPNRLLASLAGTLVEAAVCPGSMAGVDLRTLPAGARVGVCQFIALPGPNASGLAELLSHAARAFGLGEAAPSFSALRVGYFRRHSDAYAGPHAAAVLLDDDDAFERLSRALRESVRESELTHLLLPPVLGTAGAAARAQQLTELCGLPVAEMVPVQQSVPGRRLQASLNRWLEREGIEVVVGRASKPEVEAGRVRSLLVEPPEVHLDPEVARESGDETRPDAPTRYEADAVVLATGRHLGGGIVSGAHLEPAPPAYAPPFLHRRIREAVFGLPVYDGARVVDEIHSLEMTTEDPREGQRLFRCGVATDAELRPLGRSGTTKFENLYAAGLLLGGFDPAVDKCGFGVAALTGYLAGRAAAAEAARAATAS